MNRLDPNSNSSQRGAYAPINSSQQQQQFRSSGQSASSAAPSSSSSFSNIHQPRQIQPLQQQSTNRTSQPFHDSSYDSYGQQMSNSNLQQQQSHQQRSSNQHLDQLNRASNSSQQQQQSFNDFNTIDEQKSVASTDSAAGGGGGGGGRFDAYPHASSSSLSTAQHRVNAAPNQQHLGATLRSMNPEHSRSGPHISALHNQNFAAASSSYNAQPNSANSYYNSSSTFNRKPTLTRAHSISDAKGLNKSNRRGRVGGGFPALITSPLVVLSLLVTTLVALSYITSSGLSHYADRNKSTSYSIVSIMGDGLSDDTRARDRVTYAFRMNALASWAALVPASYIHVYTDHARSCEWIHARVSPGVQCRLVGECWDADFHRPLMNCMFRRFEADTATDTLLLINDDIVVTHELSSTIDSVKTQFGASIESLSKSANSGGESTKLADMTPIERAAALKQQSYFLVAHRTDFPLQQRFIDRVHDADNVRLLIDLASVTGVLNTKSNGLDLIVYDKHAFRHAIPTFPPFLASVSARYDQWLLSTMILSPHITVVDCTSSVLAIHQQLNRERAHQGRAGSIYNDELVAQLVGETYKLGRKANANSRLAGRCPDACTLQPNVDTSEEVLFTRYANPRGYLAVLTVNAGYMTLAWNWVCWAQRIDFTNYILLAEDLKSYNAFHSVGVPVYVKPGATLEKPAADYGSVEFQETMTFRTNFLLKVLNSGFHFMTADMDGLWLDDPFKYMNDESDLQGQEHKGVKISGGLVIVRSTVYGRYFWQLVIKCQEANAVFLAAAKPGSYEPSKYTEQYCINEISRFLAKQSEFKFSLLDSYLFPDGRSFFDRQYSQLRGVVPVIIHNNWIVGSGAKLQRLKDWHLHAYDEEQQQCLKPDDAPLPRPVQQTFVLRLRVMTFNRHQSLKRLLQSLAEADYEGDTVHLDVSVDFPSADADEATHAAWQQTVIAVNAYQWTRGEYNKIFHKTNIGLITQWVDGWKVPADSLNPQPITVEPVRRADGSIDDDATAAKAGSDAASSTYKPIEFILFLEDDISVTPFYYTWIKRAVHAYYLNATNYDARLFGIALQNQHTILGETPRFKYGSRDVAQLVGNSTMLYRYQLLSSWGSLFFPHHWHMFTEWLKAAQFNALTGLSPTKSPCVPTLLSSKWWKPKPSKIWTQWFIRFAYEKGFYSLYTNFPGKESLITNYREPGLHFFGNSSSGPMNPSVQRLTRQHLTFPEMTQETIPMYDYHFNRIIEPQLLSFRKHIWNEKFFFDQCYTIDQMKGRIAQIEAEALAVETAEKERKKAEKEAAKKAKDEAEKAKKGK